MKSALQHMLDGYRSILYQASPPEDLSPSADDPMSLSLGEMPATWTQVALDLEGAIDKFSHAEKSKPAN